jgi:hypothetical protein
MSETNPELALSLTESLPESIAPSTFRFGHVEPDPALTFGPGPLAAFTGTFTGNGFNTIFRPNLGSPTPLPTPPVGPDDNVLELNLTSEQLSFLPQNLLASVPNRGEIQPDIFLSGVPYLQLIQDITAQAINVPPNPPPPAVGIHLEPGLWMNVPATSAPAEGPTLTRMASIPHGTTICAQGIAQTISGPPKIPAVDITPFIPPANKITFPSQTAVQSDTWRIPQDLTPYIAAGKITQAMLDDPNIVLRNAIAGQRILSTTIISIATSPATPLFGGGTDNIAFLLGDPAATAPNAQTTQMTATFWIETVEHILLLPPVAAGSGREPVTIPVEVAEDGRPVPSLLINPPFPIPAPGRIIFTSTQIQYSQTVLLKFNGLLWPHVSVATLVPGSPLTIPPAGWAAFLNTVLRTSQSE